MVADKKVVRTEQQILVESWGNVADITITETWKNELSTQQVLPVLLPIIKGVDEPQIFKNADGLVLESLPRAMAAEQIYDWSKVNNNPGWLAALDLVFTEWWRSEVVIDSDEVFKIKYSFRQKLRTADSFNVGTIYTADGIPSDRLKIELVRAGNPTYFFANIGAWEQEQGEQALAQVWETENITFSKNLSFFSSDDPAAKLGYNYKNQGYGLAFETLKQQPFLRVVIVVDSSGSVYGARFERLQKALKTLFDDLPETTEVKIGLTGDETEWLDESWQKNTREQQRTWLDTLAGMSPQGRSDWKLFEIGLSEVASSADERVGLILLGDFSDMSEETRAYIANFGWKVLMVDFWQSESSVLAKWWQRYGHGYVALFNSGYELVEEDFLAKAWRNLSLRPSVQKSLTAGIDWRSPQTAEQDAVWSAFQQEVSPTSTTAEFIPRWWAGRKLGAYIRNALKGDLNEAGATAMLSIAHTFGLSIAGQDSQSSPAELLDHLNQLDEAVLWEEVARLESAPAVLGTVKTWNGVPHYLTSNQQWQTIDWETYAARGDRPELTLWSPAHKALFLAHPALLATPLSWGQSRFCAGQRCAWVSNLGRNEVEVTDSLLWSDEGSGHWALNHWADLVWAGVIDEPSLDVEAWKKPITRGEFVEFLVRYNFKDSDLPIVDQQVFGDIRPGQTGAAEALLLHSKNLFKGYSDGTAGLEKPLKRIEATKLLMQVQGLGIRDVLGNFDSKVPLTDLVGWTSPWGIEAYKRGFIKGYEDNTFRPFANLTYAEAFKLLVESVNLKR